MRFVGVLVFAAGLAAASLPAAGNPDTSRDSERAASPYMRVYGIAQPPYGHVEFCQRMPGECRQGAAASDQRFSASPERLVELDTVNRATNREITPATDMDIYGQTEYWTLPTARGDCEDYALLKRKRLLARGWPSSALLMTVVRDEKGEGHAVLTARTAQGDFILDNKIDEVKVWHRTGYEFVMRQSYLHPQVWMSLNSKEGGATVPLAGVRSAR